MAKKPGKKHITITYIIVYKFYTLLGRVCKLLFSIFSPSKLSTDRELSDLSLVLFCGQKGAKMLRPVLLSIYTTWEKIPPVTIITDGTPKEYIESYLKFWPFPVQVKSWQESAAFHLEKGRKSIVELSEINVFGKKLMGILAEAETRPILYCDTDIIWFGEPTLPARSPGKGCEVRISTDNIHSYHMPLLRYLKRLDMMEKSPVNSGMIYLSGSVYDHYQEFGQMMDFIKFFNEPFAEQTTFALIADHLGDKWTLNDVLLTIDDLHWPLIPRYYFSGSHFARHHVMTKHSWFWRDALYVILFKKKKRTVNSSSLVQNGKQLT